MVQRIVEFYGPGLRALSLPDRTTTSNMAPEYGATVAYFPADEHTLTYLTTTGRSSSIVRRARAYLDAQNMLYTDDRAAPIYDEVIDVDLSTIVQTVSGPSRPHQTFATTSSTRHSHRTVETDPGDTALKDNDVVIASITSCTNTSNPKAMLAAGLLARNARTRGLTSSAWTKRP